jgi:hypothetical protein
MKVRYRQTGNVYQAKLYPAKLYPGDSNFEKFSLATFDDTGNPIVFYTKNDAEHSFKLLEASPEELADLRKEGYSGPGWTV